MKDELVGAFRFRTALPDERARPGWQERNRAWWEGHPMRYDWRRRIREPEFSAPFYREIDKRFFDEAARYTPPTRHPFDRLIPFSELPRWDVLEIGVGSGSHSQLLASHCRSFTGIDLTEYATRSTRTRFALFGLNGDIRQMDAENMTFADASFDFIWTWGVIHHSADTARVLTEMYRVLRPGGRATVMVYHRSFLHTYIQIGLLRGVLCGGFRKYSLHELVQLNTDGAIARFYLPGEWKELVEGAGFVLEGQSVMGQKAGLLPLPGGRLKELLLAAVPDAASRFVTNVCRQGTFLVSMLRKP